jgi:NADH-quinone oxidoreductase subunit N
MLDHPKDIVLHGDDLDMLDKKPVNLGAMLGMVLAIAGLGFRITAVPFHFYAPDVYESGPTGVIGGLAVIPKVGGFVALAKLLGMLYPPMRELPFDTHTLIPFVLLLLSMLTMSFGNVLALMQDNLKRILAYSGIAHAGYMLLGLASAGAMPSLLAANPPAANGVDAILFYLVAYGLMTAAAFAVLMAVDRPDRPVATVDDLAGLGSERPLAAACLAVALLSMIGLPLTAGFPGKLQLFLAAFEAPTNTSMGLAFRSGALLMALNAAIAAVYYLRILGALYLRTPLKPFAAGTRLTALLAALLCTVGTLVIGIYPQPLGDAAKQAAPFSDPKFRASSRPAR